MLSTGQCQVWQKRTQLQRKLKIAFVKLKSRTEEAGESLGSETEGAGRLMTRVQRAKQSSVSDADRSQFQGHADKLKTTGWEKNYCHLFVLMILSTL